MVTYGDTHTSTIHLSLFLFLILKDENLLFFIKNSKSFENCKNAKNIWEVQKIKLPSAAQMFSQISMFLIIWRDSCFLFMFHFISYKSTLWAVLVILWCMETGSLNEFTHFKKCNACKIQNCIQLKIYKDRAHCLTYNSSLWCVLRPLRFGLNSWVTSCSFLTPSENIFKAVWWFDMPQNAVSVWLATENNSWLLKWSTIWCMSKPLSVLFNFYTTWLLFASCLTLWILK